jgi:hypothetical protein
MDLYCEQCGEQGNFGKGLDGKPLLRALNYLYKLTLNEVKAVSAQAEQSGAVNQTLSESTAQDDDFREVRNARGKTPMIPHSQPRSRLKQSQHPHLSSCLQKQCQLQLFSLLRTTTMETETTGAENILPEQEAPRKSGRSPPIVMTSTIHLIRLQSKITGRRRVRVPKHTKRTSIIKKINSGLFSNEMLPGEKI